MEDEMAVHGRPINGERCTPITLTIANVSAEAADMMMNGRAFALVWGLYRHERKVTVMHSLVKRHSEFELPIKAKDPMHIQVGFRRFTSAPIFSKVVPGTDKTLVERFLPCDEKFYLATFYGRVTLPPSSVLMFPAHILGTYKSAFPFNPLACSGTLQSCNPNKVVLKRSVLTGFPIHVAKNHAVVRHMFFNSNDVRWFKPIELWTKTGRHGHITEPRGLHGLFKCQFDNTLKKKEAICMSLYKRQFPPWNPEYLG
jgi:pre-rRNA-processing protein TSR1